MIFKPKRNVLSFILSGMVALSAIHMPTASTMVYATEIESEDVDQEVEIKVFDWDTHYDVSTGQINASEFTTPANGRFPLTISATLVEGFDADCYIYLVENEHQEKKIRIDLYPEESFTKTIYLPNGYYQVVESGAVQSPTVSFTLNSVSVSLSDLNEETTLSMVLNNGGHVQKNDLGIWEDKSVSELGTTTKKLYGVEALKDLGIQSDYNGVLYYSVEHTGAKRTRMVDKEVKVTKDGQEVIEIQQVEEVYYDEPGLGYVTPYGSATLSRDIVLMISREGVVGQAEFKVSYDGGQTFVAKYVTSEAVSDPNIGLTYSFYTLNDTDEFTEGDRFHFKSIESFAVKNSGSSPDSRIVCTGHPLNSHELEISVLSSGGRGVSRVKVTDLKNKMETKTYLVPNDGIIFLDDNLTLYFENVKGYVKGIEYTIEIASHDTTINYTPLIILGVGASALLIAGFFWLLLKKDKASDYIVHAYEWKQDESIYRN